MGIKCKRKKDTLIAVLDGELDHHHAVKVREELDKLLQDTSIKNLIFDLARLNFMDSSGIGVFIGRYKTISKRGGATCIANVSQQLHKVIEVSGLYNIFKQYDSVKDALDDIQGGHQ